MKKLIFLFVVILIAGCGIKSQLKKLPIVSGYSAKKLCSYTFISERSPDIIESEDLAMFPLSLASNDVNYKNKSVTSTVMGMGKKTAIFKEDLGCVLLYGEDDHNISLDIPSSLNDKFKNYPYGDIVPKEKTHGIDHVKVQKAVDDFFDPNGEMTSLKTRALLVIHNDTIIAEKYAKGIDKDTELLGWSMTKSIMNTWVGMMVKDSIITLSDKSLFDEWNNDERKNITLDHLMHMSSGLDWQEVYDKVSGATTMLFDSEDIVKTALSPALAYKPGEHWYYSSGTSNLIAGYIRKQFANHQDYLEFPYKRIFHKLGMNNTTLESDEIGNYIGSSYCYATARDWGRFGTLYLHDGVWDGERLLPEGWVEYSKTEVIDSKGYYGAQFWLNKRGVEYPDAPHDILVANGFQGQRVFIIPSKNLVIVRLGLNEEIQFNDLLKDITESIND